MVSPHEEFHIVAFDPGGTIGWAHLTIHKRAFIKPANKVLSNLLAWETGEFDQDEYNNIKDCVFLMRLARWGMKYDNTATAPIPVITRQVEYLTEDFELTQLVGGRNLLSPVRINAVLAWECAKIGEKLYTQKRTLRTGVTRARLKLWGMKAKGKDSFAAMQHAIVWARRTKQKANQRPWPKDWK